MNVAKTGDAHLVSGPTSATSTYAEYWQALTAETVRAEHGVVEEESDEPLPIVRTPTPSPPPSRRVQPSITQKNAASAAALAPHLPPTSLTATSEYRLNLYFTPSAQKAERSLQQRQQQQQQDLICTTKKSEHAGGGRRETWIKQVMRTGKEAALPGEQPTHTPPSARVYPLPTPPAVSRTPLSPALDIAPSRSDKDRDTLRRADSIHAPHRHPAVVQDTRPAANTFDHQKHFPSSSGDNDLVDSPRQHYSVARNTLVQYAPPLTQARGAAHEYGLLSYTPDDLVVKAAQCYEEWRQCIMADDSPDTSGEDDHSAGNTFLSDRGSQTAGDSEAGDDVRGLNFSDDTALGSAETPADHRRGLVVSHGSKAPPGADSSFSLAYPQKKQDSRYTDNIQSPALSAETTAHGLTSGRKDQDSDTDSRIIEAALSPSLSTRMRASTAVENPFLQVTPTGPTVCRSVGVLDKKVDKQLTVEITVGMSVEKHGVRSHSARLLQRQEAHQRSEMRSQPTTSSIRADGTSGKYMSEDSRLVDVAAGSLHSSLVEDADEEDSRSTAPPSFVYRRLFADESEDGVGEGGDTIRYDPWDGCHTERSRATTPNNAPLACTLSFDAGRHGQSPSAALFSPSRCHREVIKMTGSGADNLHETLIELSSSSSSNEGYHDKAEGAVLIGDEASSQTEVGHDQPERMSSHEGTASPFTKIFGDLSLLSASCLPFCVPQKNLREKGNGDGVDGTALAAPDDARGSLLHRDHTLWRKHHASVSMQYASRLLPSEQANDELQCFLCWAQEKAEQRIRLQQQYLTIDMEKPKETVSETSEIVAGLSVSGAVSEVYKTAYAVARPRRCASTPLFEVQQGGVSHNSECEAAVEASPNGSPLVLETPSTGQQTRDLPHPPVFVATPLSSSEVARPPAQSEEVAWTLTPSAAPSRFIEWIATEADPYESLLFCPLWSVLGDVSSMQNCHTSQKKGKEERPLERCGNASLTQADRVVSDLGENFSS